MESNREGAIYLSFLNDKDVKAFAKKERRYFLVLHYHNRCLSWIFRVDKWNKPIKVQFT